MRAFKASLSIAVTVVLLPALVAAQTNPPPAAPAPSYPPPPANAPANPPPPRVSAAAARVSAAAARISAAARAATAARIPATAASHRRPDISRQPATAARLLPATATAAGLLPATAAAARLLPAAGLLPAARLLSAADAPAGAAGAADARLPGDAVHRVPHLRGRHRHVLQAGRDDRRAAGRPREPELLHQRRAPGGRSQFQGRAVDAAMGRQRSSTSASARCFTSSFPRGPASS